MARRRPLTIRVIRGLDALNNLASIEGEEQHMNKQAIAEMNAAGLWLQERKAEYRAKGKDPSCKIWKTDKPTPGEVDS